MGDTVNGSQPFTAICQKHAQVLVEGLWNLFQAKNGTDYNFRLGGESVPAHRLILEVFLQPEKLDQNSDKEVTSEDSEPHMSDGRNGILDSVLEFLYTGAVTVPEARRHVLLDAAKELDFQMLVDAIEVTSERDEIRILRPRRSKAVIRNCRRPNLVRRAKITRTQTGPPPKNDLAQEDEPNFEAVERSCDSRFAEPDNQDADDDDEGDDVSYFPVSQAISKRGTNTIKRSKVTKQREGRALRMYHCSHCDFETSKRHGYHYHLKSVHEVTTAGAPSPKLRCPECDHVAMYRSDVHRHQMARHPKKCPHCSLTFGPQSHLTKHLELVHDKTCLEGSDGGSSGSKVQMPTDNDDGGGCSSGDESKSRDAVKGTPGTKSSGDDGSLPAILKCSRCDFQSTIMFAYRRHLGSVHGVTVTGEPAPTFQCTDCDYSSTNLTYFKNHRKFSHATEKPFKCPHCDHATVRKDSLATHLNVVHGLGTSQVLCETCGKRCQSSSALILHNRIHTHEKPFACPHCDLTFNAKGKLKRHTGFVHGLGPNQFTCETCGHRCPTRSHLVEHQRTHSQEKPFKCPHCSHASSDKRNLASHVSIVHGVGPSQFTCETCGKRCHSRARLDLHRRTHTRARPFKCPHCTEAFVGKVSYNKHQSVVHGYGSNRFACETCGEWCGSQTALLIHGRTHTNERPFKCHLCSYASIHSGNLKTHLMKVHKVNFDPNSSS